MKGRTRVNHPPEAPLPADNRPLVAPIHQTVKFAYDSLEETLRFNRGEREGYFYTRRANPTTRQLELLLAELQQRDDCVATGSGAAAVATCLLSQLRAGDHLLCFVETYGPTLALIRSTLARLGVTHTMLSVEDDTGIERALAERKTKLVYFESPTNPVTRIADIARITRAAHAAGALTVMDNTFAGFHNHGQYGVDIFVHSLTKYASGHGDVMGGAIITRTDLAQAIRREAVLLGPLLDPHAAFLVMRGLKTLELRMERHASTAQAIANRLAGHKAVEKVFYPGLASHPNHKVNAKQARNGGGMLSFSLGDDARVAAKCVHSTRLFQLAESLGAVESLIQIPALMTHASVPPEMRKRTGLADGLIRLSPGIEDPEDLWADLKQAIEKATG